MPVTLPESAVTFTGIRSPALPGHGAGRIRPGFILRPYRQAQLLALAVGTLDQIFFLASLSGSVTLTVPARRFRTARPVSHQLRAASQR
jgi:hypothetical protein